MPGPQPLPLSLTVPQRAILEGLVRRQTSPQRLVWRAQTILAAADGAPNAHIAQRLGLTRTTVHTWRERWRVAAPHLDLPEAEEPDAPPLAVRIEACLADAPRPGTPATFTPEQLTQLIALACEAPQDSGRPVTHWTPKELADELVQRDIVVSISPRTIGRFLKRSRSQAPSDPVLAQS
jgi:putative transposase